MKFNSIFEVIFTAFVVVICLAFGAVAILVYEQRGRVIIDAPIPSKIEDMKMPPDDWLYPLEHDVKG